MNILKKIGFIGFMLLLFSCPNDDLEDEMQSTDAVTYELLSFVFTPQTDTTEDGLAFEIRFTNPNNFEVTGIPKITTTVGGGATVTWTPNDQCQIIAANSTCLWSYEVVDDDPNVFPNEPIEFVDAEYTLD